MGSGEHGADRGRGPVVRRPGAVAIAGGALVAAAVAGAVFFAVRSGEKPLPEMPRARFSAPEVDGALTGLRARAARFVPTGDERHLAGEMRSMHLAEVGASLGAERRERSRAQLDAFRKSAAALAGSDRERFVGLGEKLAVELQDATEAFLLFASKEGLDAALAGPGEALDRVVAAGGLFVRRSAERGLIGPGGRLEGPRLLPEVLFRRRWCGAVGLEGSERFSAVEERAALDFTAAFTTNADSRLRAIDALEKLDPSYDALVARALVLHAAGATADARALVERGIASGRTDRAIGMLRDALAP